MSRYSLKPLPQHSEVFEVAVGWDGGLDTYFVIVFGVPDRDFELEVRHWRGAYLRDVPTFSEFLMATRRYAVIPNEVSAQLGEAPQLYPHNLALPFREFIMRFLPNPYEGKLRESD